MQKELQKRIKEPLDVALLNDDPMSYHDNSETKSEITENYSRKEISKKSAKFWLEIEPNYKVHFDDTVYRRGHPNIYLISGVHRFGGAKEFLFGQFCK